MMKEKPDPYINCTCGRDHGNPEELRSCPDMLNLPAETYNKLFPTANNGLVRFPEATPIKVFPLTLCTNCGDSYRIGFECGCDKDFLITPVERAAFNARRDRHIKKMNDNSTYAGIHRQG
ncbi:MAG: hypothetical protein ACUZ8I_10455 [Candidatus Scalindua sp.]